MATPTNYPEWALLDETDPITGAENVLQPILSFRQYGAKRQQEVPRGFLNYQGRLVHDWIKDLDERTPNTGEVSLLVENNLDDLDDTATARNNLDVYEKSYFGTAAPLDAVGVGGIIETGSNANGVYTKFLDGTLICTRTSNLSLKVFTAQDNIYRSGESSWTFPFSFSSNPVLSGGIEDDNTWINAVSGDTTATGTIYLYKTNNSNTENKDLYLQAIGRWF
jgi:hypothetical protein